MTKDIVTRRCEFVAPACKEGANVAELCCRFGISRKSAYEWLARAEGVGELSQALADRSRRPQRSPGCTEEPIEKQLLASRYQPSARSLPKTLPPIEYGTGDEVRTVKAKGEICWRNRSYYIGNGLRREPIAVRPTSTDGIYEVFFRHQRLGWIDLHQPPARSKFHYLPLLKTHPHRSP